MGSVIVSNQIKKTIKTYSPADLSEAHTLGYEQLADVGALLSAVISEFKTTKNYLNQTYKVPESCFGNLKRLLAITNVLLDDSADHSQSLANRYEQELKNSEGSHNA